MLSRRRFLVVAAGAVLAACRAGEGEDPAPSAEGDAGEGQGSGFGEDEAPPEGEGRPVLELPDEPLVLQDPAAGGAGGPGLLIAGAMVFDGLRVLEGPQEVLVRDGAVVEVGSSVSAPGVERVEADGRFLLPGLIDSHIHSTGSWGAAYALLFGVTTEIGMGCPPEAIEQVRSMQQGAPIVADLRSSGLFATAPGGHGTQFGGDPPTLTDPEEAAGWVADRVEDGSDFIKIIAERMFGLEPLPDATVDALIEAAHAQQLMAVVHVSEAEIARRVVEAGADGLAHAFFDSQGDVEAAVAACREADAFVVSTLAVLDPARSGSVRRGLAEDERITRWMPADDASFLTASSQLASGSRLERAAGVVAAMHEAGVTVLAGTDAANQGTNGATMHAELGLLVDAGLSPLEALAAATAQPAARFGLDDRGRIEPGRRADLLLIGGDPTNDIEATRELDAIFVRGHHVERAKAVDEIQRVRTEIS
jgi:imidazolonepropionase-like amidohydrolase